MARLLITNTDSRKEGLYNYVAYLLHSAFVTHDDKSLYALTF